MDPTVRFTSLSRLSLTDIGWGDRKSTRLNSSHLVISYAVFCLKKKTLAFYARDCSDLHQYSLHVADLAHHSHRHHSHLLPRLTDPHPARSHPAFCTVADRLSL